VSLTLELARPSATALALALVIDLLFGELPARLHPVVWMGALIRWGEKVMPERGVYRQLLGGGLLALVVPLGSAGLAAATLGLLAPWPIAGFVVEVLSLTAMFAARGLGDAARQVRLALDAAELGAARRALSSLCSRDPSLLTGEELVGASIESVAENTSDSFVAPLFYYVLLGLPGAVFYRAVNTLDAMVGYHGRYEYLGKASARLDDALNFIPARLTAALLLLGGALAKKNVRRGLAVWRRDAATTESPNAGRPMAAMAGLLGVRLEKAGHYQLGDAIEGLAPHHIGVAWRIVQLAGAAWFLLVLSALAVAAHSG
jgi:adenosylcobinamide-phosphate synthase